MPDVEKLAIVQEIEDGHIGMNAAQLVTWFDKMRHGGFIPTVSLRSISRRERLRINARGAGSMLVTRSAL